MTKLQKLYIDMTKEDKNGNNIFIRYNRLTLCEYREMQQIFNALSAGNSETTIMKSVADLFRKYQFGVFPHGIGWEIKMNRQPKRQFEECVKAIYGEDFFNA